MQLLTISEAAKKINRSYAFIRKKIEEGNIKALRVGSTFRIPLEELEEFKKNFNNNHNIDGYTISEAAKILKVSYSLVNSLIKNEDIKAVKDGRKFIIPRDEFDTYIRNNYKTQENDSENNNDETLIRETTKSANDNSEGLLDQIKKLKELLEVGAISKSEFDEIKRKLILKI